MPYTTRQIEAITSRANELLEEFREAMAQLTEAVESLVPPRGSEGSGHDGNGKASA